MTPSATLLVAVLAFPAANPAGNSAEVAFFEKHVRPLLATRCVSCHGAVKPKGKLRLDTAAGIRKGGESGPAVVPGKPEQSLLIQAVAYATDLKMPPKSKLPRAEVAVLEAWVKRGAALPEGKAESPVAALPKEGRISSDHWAFQPVCDPAVPTPPGTKGEARSPIDQFILARLAQKALTPAPAADRRTLIRRATFDLIGLPPTPEEIRAFLADSSPDAFAKVVDRLLASPHYGERWGRHWLDVARYADSNGMDENLVQANAWRYRDYVIRAFNLDLPYPQFVTEQLAGDLLPNPSPEQLIATGFLALGPKMLAEDDPVKMQMDIVDEQIDTTGKTFLGLTLGCARCHDHKFDPIPTTDYYALAGIFKSTRVMDNYKVVARWHERPVGARADVERLLAHRRKIDEAKRAAAEKSRAANEQVLAAVQPQAPRYVEAARELTRRQAALRDLRPRMEGKGTPAGAVVVEAENYARGNVKKDFSVYGQKIGVIYNAGPLPNLAEYDVAVPKGGTYQLELRYAAAQSRPVEVAINGKVVNGRAAAAVTGTWHPDSQKWFAEGVFTLAAGKNTVRLKCEGPFPHFDKLALVPRVLPKGTSALVPVTAEQFAAEHKLDPTFLRQWAAFLAKKPDPTAAEVREAAASPAGPFALPKDPSRLYPASIQAEMKRLRDAVAALEKSAPTLPEAMGAAEGQISNVRVHLRGNHLTLGAEVPRRFPRVMSGDRQPPIGPSRSGRLELARWMTDPANPLTARVMVNRVWHWHFGAGLVRSTDNFGILGETPSHPELLDWLARRFVEDGWSVKALHRRIMLSAAYQRSAAWDERAALGDPDNRLLWRWNRQRLDAESLRDALLAVSGSLDATMGGSLLEGKNRGYVPGYPNGIYEKYDFPRRSVYLPVIRSMLYDVFQAFDFADPSAPSGERASTTIAPQALFALNGKLMAEQSREFARALLASPGQDGGRVGRAYERAFGRPASAAETRRALDFVERLQAEWARQGVAGEERRHRAWQGLCRVLLSANEFTYVE